MTELIESTGKTSVTKILLSCKYDLAIAIVAIILAVGHFSGLLWYGVGFFGPKLSLNGYIFYLLLLYPLAFVYLFLRMIVSINKRSKYQLLLRISIVIATIVSGLLSYQLFQPPHIFVARGFYQKVKAQVDVTAIRIWLEEQNVTSTEDRDISSSQWPDPIKMLSPHSVITKRFDDNNSMVRIMLLQSNFITFHWGLDVSSTSHKPPPPAVNAFILELDPGAYVFSY